MDSENRTNSKKAKGCIWKPYKQLLLKAEPLDLANHDWFGISGLLAPEGTLTSCWGHKTLGVGSFPKCLDPDTGDKGLPLRYFVAPNRVISGCFLCFLLSQFLSSDSQIVAALVSGLSRSLRMSGTTLRKPWLGRRLPIGSIVLFSFNPIGQLWLVTCTLRTGKMISFSWTLHWTYSAGVDILKENLMFFSPLIVVTQLANQASIYWMPGMHKARFRGADQRKATGEHWGWGALGWLSAGIHTSPSFPQKPESPHGE